MSNLALHPPFNALVVDADVDRRDRFVEVLMKQGFHVPATTSALPHDLQSGVDVFVLSGAASAVDQCRRIREHADYADTVVLMLTPHNDAEAIESAYDAGATETLPLPVVWPAFARRVSHIQDFLQAQRLTSESRARRETFLRAVPDMIMLVDRDGNNLTPLIDNAGTAFDFSDFPDRLVKSWKREIRQAIDTGEIKTSEFRSGDADDRHYFELRVVRYTDTQAMMIFRDVTTQKRANAKVFRLAFYDPLTGLPNRQSFMTRIGEAIRESSKNGGQFSLLYLDLDNFKRINDSLGHTVGDELLKVMSRRIEDCVRSDDVIGRGSTTARKSKMHMARLGGDEFTILLRGVDSSDIADRVAERLSKAVSRPIVHDGRQFVFTSSIGIVNYPEDGTDMDTLIANADMAMYRAKESGKNTVRSFSETMSVRSLEHLELEGDLRSALANQELELHYQPKLCLRTGRITGFEALSRWNHPERGFVSPAKFVRIAEEAGLILDLSDWVLQEACRQLQHWQQGPLVGLPVAINLSGQQFKHSDVDKLISAAVHKRGLRPEMLELELTESELMADAHATVATLNKLKQAGFKISVDDFGTGYSSLAYLNRFPIDSLKIDRSFAMRTEESSDNFSICSAIIALAHSLNLRVVAEGVESLEHQRKLIQLDCDEMQGYLLSRPQAAAGIEAMVVDYNQNGGIGQMLASMRGDAAASA